MKIEWCLDIKKDICTCTFSFLYQEFLIWSFKVCKNLDLVKKKKPKYISTYRFYFMSLCCCLAGVYIIHFIHEMPGGGDVPPHITSIAHQKPSEGVLCSKKHSWWLIISTSI